MYGLSYGLPDFFNTFASEKQSMEINQDILDKINQALDDVRPHLAVDGGNIELVEVTEDGVVRIKWIGNCEFCSMSSMTMKAGVEHAIKSRVPDITGVEAINGYYSYV